MKKQALLESAAVFVGVVSSGWMAPQAALATTIYADRTSFEAALSASVIDDYSNPGYVFNQQDAEMSSVLGETDYSSTGFLPGEFNLVVDIIGNGNLTYCAGCNGSFILSFTTTSVGTSDGVFGVGFQYLNEGQPSYDAFVVFGDNSHQNIPLASTSGNSANRLDNFFGLTSHLFIKSIAFGLPNGGTSKNGYFAIDNLTIGSQPVPQSVPGPLPLLGVGAAFGFSRKLRKRIKGSTPVA